MNYTRGAIWIAKSFVFMWCTLQVYSLNANVFKLFTHETAVGSAINWFYCATSPIYLMNGCCLFCDYYNLSTNQNRFVLKNNMQLWCRGNLCAFMKISNKSKAENGIKSTRKPFVHGVGVNSSCLNLVCPKNIFFYRKHWKYIGKNIYFVFPRFTNNSVFVWESLIFCVRSTEPCLLILKGEQEDKRRWL